MANIPEYAENAFLTGISTTGDSLVIPFEYYDYEEQDDSYLTSDLLLATTDSTYYQVLLDDCYLNLNGKCLEYGQYTLTFNIVIYTKNNLVYNYPNFFRTNRLGEYEFTENAQGSYFTHTFSNGDKINVHNIQKDNRTIEGVEELRSLITFDGEIQVTVSEDTPVVKLFDEIGVASDASNNDYYVQFTKLSISPEPTDYVPKKPINIYYQLGKLATPKEIEADESGITNPNLHRRIDIPDDSITQNYSLLISGVTSYRIRQTSLHDEESTTSEIP